VKPASFSEHKIPGTINCVDYDFGRQSIAYFDKDFQNSQGLGSGATWNKGGEYRNDGVDIELCSDAGGAKYNIGWIENEEWIKYTVQVEETGIYDINLRIASPNSSGKIQLFLNDQALTSSVSVTNTQGWKTWQTISITNIEIPSGSFILKLSFPLGGFNIEYLQFRLKTSLEEGNNNSSKPDKIVLKQNYPNPFFLHAGTIVSTKIGFICKEIGIMDLSIHNVLGQKIYSDLMAVDLIGTSEFIWDGKNLFGNLVDSGVYFYTVSKTNQKLEVKQTRKMIVL
jgi:hypothetical protein